MTLKFEHNAKWQTAPLGEIIDFIIPRFHEKHRSQLPQLIEMATKVEERHSDSPNCPKGLATILQKIYADLTSHMMKEENILFHLIKMGNGPMAAAPISVMEAEHAEADDDLNDIRQLTNQFALPEGACTTWTNLYNGLAEFANDLDEHVELENHILFPRALRGEQP